MKLKYYDDLLTKKLSRIIKKGDTLYLESDLTSFRKIFLCCKSKKQFLNFFLNIFNKLIGVNGTLIVPSFSYSWGNNKKIKYFDLKKTESETGIFSKYIFKKKPTRTLDPMFSCLILGKKKSYYSNNSNNSFGPGSIFEKLLIQNAKLVSFGLNRFDPTFVHYVEQFFDTNFKKINYRYLKKISGIIIKDKKRYKDNYFTFLRKKNNKFYNEKNIKKDLLKAKKLNWIKLLNTNIYIVEAKDFYNFGITGMKKNKNYFIK